MKHAILLLWHKDLQQLRELIRFFDEDFVFYIHIDKKSVISAGDIEDLKRTHEDLHFYCKYKINWGGFNILRAELFLLQEIVKEGKDIDYIHFFSGQDYPIKKLNHIKSFFEENKGYEYMEYMKLPSEKWDYGTYDRFSYYRFLDFWDIHTPKGAKKVANLVKFQRKIGYKRRIPDRFDHLYGGSNWMSITQECAKYIVDNQKQNKPFYNRLKYTFASDEVYFHTVILNSPLAKKVRNDNLRCILWGNNSSSPRTLTEKDWWSVATSDCLFARKWDTRLSAKIHKKHGIFYAGRIKRSRLPQLTCLYIPYSWHIFRNLRAINLNTSFLWTDNGLWQALTSTKIAFIFVLWIVTRSLFFIMFTGLLLPSCIRCVLI